MKAILYVFAIVGILMVVFPVMAVVDTFLFFTGQQTVTERLIDHLFDSFFPVDQNEIDLLHGED